ncbi:MAG: tetratricopeptide repeat protein [Geobacteraceae bacterium]
MKKESTSFWADIKKYEDILAKDPNSYCFAPLSELYRKLGLLDDAVAVAKQGIEVHPLYIGGFMALGRALHEKGGRDEAKAALEKVVLATPENLLAQRILSQIYQDEGNLIAAERALQLLVTFNPEDMESSIALEVLQHSLHKSEDSQLLSAPFQDFSNESREESPEDSCLAEGETLSVSTPPVELPEFNDLDDAHDQFLSAADSFSFDEMPESETKILPLPTVTLAELYEGQGFLDKALEVYQDLLEKDPESCLLKERATALSSRLTREADQSLTEAAYAISAKDEANSPLGTSVAKFSDNAPGFSDINDQGPDEGTLNVLGQWLDAVRRRKECR